MSKTENQNDNDNPFIPTQNVNLFQHFKKGRSITRLEALDLFGVINLPGRIFDLKEQGLLIQDKWVTLKNKKRVKCYWTVSDL